jgi:hypothetical protein
VRPVSGEAAGDRREHGSMPQGHHPRARGVASDVAAAHLSALCAARVLAADRYIVSPERGSWHFGWHQALTSGVDHGSAGAQAHVLGKFAPPVPERCSRARWSPRSCPCRCKRLPLRRQKDLRSAQKGTRRYGYGGLRVVGDAQACRCTYVYACADLLAYKLICAYICSHTSSKYTAIKIQ